MNRMNRPAIPAVWRDPSTWPSVEVSALPAEAQPRFERRRNAITEAVLGARTTADISETYGISRAELYRLLKRCLVLHEDGRIWGFRALVIGVRVIPYVRTKKADARSTRGAGLAGAFSSLLRNFPQLREFLERAYFGRDSSERVGERRASIKKLHKAFLEECRKIGISATEYPLNCGESGRRSLYAFVKKLRLERPAEAIRTRESDDAARLWTGTGIGPSPAAPSRPFERVEIDGHRVDLRLSCEVLTESGPMLVEIERIWILAVLECFSRAILGYYISLSPEYSAQDVRLALLNCFTPPPRLPLTIKGLQYPEGGRVPCEHIPELQWVAWDETRLDNAMAHRSTSVCQTITKVIGSRVCFGPPATPVRRARVERWFGLFEENSFHRLPMTTGSKPGDGKPSRHICLQKEAEELIDVLVAEYNHRPRPVLSNRTPMEILAAHTKHPNRLWRKIPQSLREPLHFSADRYTRFVSGDPAKGRRPYVNFECARYSNAVLARAPELIGRELTILVDRRDVRVIAAYTSDGSELGHLTARGAWGTIPHTLEMRKQINALQRKGVLPSGDNAIPAYLEHLQDRAKKSRKDASKLARAQAAGALTKPEGSRPSTEEGSDTTNTPVRPARKDRKALL